MHNTTQHNTAQHGMAMKQTLLESVALVYGGLRDFYILQTIHLAITGDERFYVQSVLYLACLLYERTKTTGIHPRVNVFLYASALAHLIGNTYALGLNQETSDLADINRHIIFYACMRWFWADVVTPGLVQRV